MNDKMKNPKYLRWGILALATLLVIIIAAFILTTKSINDKAEEAALANEHPFDVPKGNYIPLNPCIHYPKINFHIRQIIPERTILFSTPSFCQPFWGNTTGTVTRY